MEKIFKVIKFIIDFIINLTVLVGLIIVVSWIFWDVTPQTSITKTAYFFSESWRIMSGRHKNEEPFTQVGKEQLEEPRKHIHTLQPS